MNNINEVVLRQLLLPAKTPHRWFGVDYEANMYSDSDGLRIDFGGYAIESKILPVQNSVEILKRDLEGKPKNLLIGIGQSVEPYNDLEPELKLTHNALEIIRDSQDGVVIFTRSDGIIADIDLLKQIALHAPVRVIMAISTMNDEVAKKIEPKTTPTQLRFKTLQKLKNEGIQTGILMMPIVPYINDTEENILQIINRAKEVGSDFIYPAFGMILTDIRRRRFYEMIDREFPGLKNIYMDQYGSKHSCQSPYASKLKKVFVFECKKHKIKYGMGDIVKSINPDTTIQMKLF